MSIICAILIIINRWVTETSWMKCFVFYTQENKHHNTIIKRTEDNNEIEFLTFFFFIVFPLSFFYYLWSIQAFLPLAVFQLRFINAKIFIINSSWFSFYVLLKSFCFYCNFSFFFITKYQVIDRITFFIKR